VSPIRVLVVEDSLTVRKRLVETLAEDPELHVAGEAQDGKEAIELCQRLRPDVVTIDMMMPVMSGVAAVEYIMAYCPTPILVVSASTNRGELFRTYDALAAGAIDVLDKPKGDERAGAWEERFRATVKLISRIKVITHPRARLASARDEAPVPARLEPPGPPSAEPSEGPALVAIGGSTGAPAAIVEILSRLPRDFPVPILLVIHINEPFGVAFAEWLDGLSPIRVRYAREGDVLSALRQPVVLMAPPGRHLVLQRGGFQLSDVAERHSCKPSVDVLFESLAREVGGGTVACLLTGMGRDGAGGMLAIHRAGGTTIAQDDATSVVYGMPREAVRLGAATRVLPIQDIGPALVAITRRRPRPVR
jgi:two-component system chemotaxis response regulator CheB